MQSSRNNDEPLDFIWTGDAPIAEGGKQLIEAQGKKVLENEATLSDPLVLVVNKADANICLLYTSPSPRDGLLSRMPSSA